MSPARKLAAFAAALALVFGVAAVAGGAIGPDRKDGPRKTASHGGDAAMGDDMATHTTSKTDPVRGLSVSEDGLTLALESSELGRGQSTDLRFAILGRDGRPVRDFAVEHERKMHFIVVRRDGRGFQHLHPSMDADGTWHVRLTLPDAGSYRVFADFKRAGAAETLAADLAVDGNADYRPLPAPATSADTGDGYQVRVERGPVSAGSEAQLRFTVTRGGRVVRTEPYLGAGGHLVALREGDLAYLHVHPDESSGAAIPFMTEFPSNGRYRLYLQFKHEGRVHTAEFTQEVTR